MSFSFFLPLVTYPDPTPATAFTRALDFAATLGGEVHAQVVEVDIPPIDSPLPTFSIDVTAMAEAAEARSRAAGQELSERLAHAAERVAVPLAVETVRSRTEFTGGLLAKAARAHDMSLLCVADTLDQRDMSESVLFESGGPIVLFPEEDGPMHLSRVAVAWDGSRAAARALRDALPVLALSDEVLILTAERDKVIDPKSVEAVIALLDVHGIKASHQQVLMIETPSIAEALEDAALRKDAGLLVMGAYGHNRFREFVLGGATNSILSKRRLPVLMSH